MPILTAVTHADLIADVRALAAKIARETAWRPDWLVGVGRGGLVPAVYLSHAAGVPMQSVDYSAQDDARAAPAIERLAALTRDGQRLLFVDDINDSGRTIAQLRTLLEQAGAARTHVRFATLIDNRGSAAKVDLAARTIDRAVTKDWFVFPWEALAPATSIAADADEVPERTA
ncbi:hypoxanthine phosphoribosyltransferase [Sphingomonas sp. BE138]|uniref:phosphoribosyltransferase n=1 Tax=Sphingomonas sp. BE138 TaxID=2817845 RepID=UPI0028609402|nr:phosphoribosyltransferase domain-containing protein [Sphingomonas sp. BE138]MDR6788352.1 hypoxanthine phosphoribosyltransferase [Sphingomonas sp. BE138]